MTGVEVVDLGEREYGEVLELQRGLVERVATGEPERLLLVEHPNVVTLGRGTRPDPRLPKTIPVFEIERGGDATYHGPGQLVGYPLLRLADHELGIHTYLRRLEESLIRTLSTFGIAASRVERKTGVWVGERKIASIGIAVRKGVSLHGFALNVSTDLRYFHTIQPCGLDPSVMTSIEALRGANVALPTVKTSFLQAFEETFGLSLRSGSDEEPPLVL